MKQWDSVHGECDTKESFGLFLAYNKMMGWKMCLIRKAEEIQLIGRQVRSSLSGYYLVFI